MKGIFFFAVFAFVCGAVFPQSGEIYSYDNIIGRITEGNGIVDSSGRFLGGFDSSLSATGGTCDYAVLGTSRRRIGSITGGNIYDAAGRIIGTVRLVGGYRSAGLDIPHSNEFYDPSGRKIGNITNRQIIDEQRGFLGRVNFVSAGSAETRETKAKLVAIYHFFFSPIFPPPPHPSSESERRATTERTQREEAAAAERLRREEETRREEAAAVPSYMENGTAAFNRNDWDRAIAEFTRVIRIDPRYAIAYNNRGAAYNGKNDWDRAIADFTEAIRLDPNYAAPYRHRAFAYMQKGNYAQARIDVNRALQVNPNYQNARDLSAELQRRGY